MTNDIFCGEKVRLAALEIDREASFLAANNRNSQYMRLLDGEPAKMWSTRREQEQLEQYQGSGWLFVIRTVAEDRSIGMIDLEPVDWAAGNAWIGIGIRDPDYWGKGYGTEAMRILLRYAFGELNLHRVSLDVFGYNPRAIHSYLKAGFKEEGRRRMWLNRAGKRWDLIYMGILRSEWEALQRNS
jgi:RimJ/RimL family protein N-acetyltransferase